MIKEVTEARFDEMLGVLPPALHLSKGFLVGEPHDHRKCKVTGQTAPTFAAFFTHRGKFFESDPMTFAEFRRFDPETLPT
jgi:hypothetical protein